MKAKDSKKHNPAAYDCKQCLNYEWYDDEVGYQCIYLSQPPCDGPDWPTDN